MAESSIPVGTIIHSLHPCGKPHFCLIPSCVLSCFFVISLSFSIFPLKSLYSSTVSAGVCHSQSCPILTAMKIPKDNFC